MLENVREGWRRSEKVEKVRGSSRKFEKVRVREGRRRSEKGLRKFEKM